MCKSWQEVSVLYGSSNKALQFQTNSNITVMTVNPNIQYLKSSTRNLFNKTIKTFSGFEEP